MDEHQITDSRPVYEILFLENVHNSIFIIIIVLSSLVA